MNTRPSACKADALPAELLKDIGDATGTRTPITAVKGRCPNRLDDSVILLVDRPRIELGLPACKAGVLTVITISPFGGQGEI